MIFLLIQDAALAFGAAETKSDTQVFNVLISIDLALL